MCDIDDQRLTIRGIHVGIQPGCRGFCGFPWAQGKAFAAWPGMPDGKLRADCPIIGNSNNVPWRARGARQAVQGGVMCRSPVANDIPLKIMKEIYPLVI